MSGKVDTAGWPSSVYIWVKYDYRDTRMYAYERLCSFAGFTAVNLQSSKGNRKFCDQSVEIRRRFYEILQYSVDNTGAACYNHKP